MPNDPYYEADDGFNLPGVFDPVPDGTPAAFHQAGLDRLSVMYDPADLFGNDNDIAIDTPKQRRREHLPQAGPNFVAVVEDKISDVDRKLNELREHLLSQWMYQSVTLVVVGSVETNAAGIVDTTTTNGGIIFNSRPGFTLAVHRFGVRVLDPTFTKAGSNFGNPFNAALGYWEMRVNGDAADGASLVANIGSFPVVKTWGTRDAPRVRDGEVLSLFVNGTASLANTQLYVRMQGTFDRTAEG